MSRSRKKFACVKNRFRDNGFNKRLANKRIRMAKEFSTNGSAYRRLFKNSEIYEFRLILTNRELRGRDWECKKDYISK